MLALSNLLRKAFVDECCQFDVVITQTLAIVSGQGNLNLVVHVEPLRMMVHLVGLQSKALKLKTTNTCTQTKYSKCLKTGLAQISDTL